MKSGDGSDGYKSKNKTWKCKDNEKFKKAVKQELKLLMKGKDLNSMDVDHGDRKRKADSDSDDASMHSAKSSLSRISLIQSKTQNASSKKVTDSGSLFRGILNLDRMPVTRPLIAVRSGSRVAS